MNKSERSHSANQLKAVFNKLWDESLKRNSGSLPYRDMTRIADALRHEGPPIIKNKGLPVQVEASLELATSLTDPNKVRMQESFKKSLSLISTGGGLGLASLCLANLLNPGVWAVVVAVFAGSIATGPGAIFGIAGGITIISGSVYFLFQKMSPEERAVKAHRVVCCGIDSWIKNGGGDQLADSQRAAVDSSDHSLQGELSKKLSNQDLLSVACLLEHVSACDNHIHKKELQVIEDAMGISWMDANRLSVDESINSVSVLPEPIRKEIIAWCFGVAYADGSLHPKEDLALKKLCSSLQVDYDSFLSIFEKTLVRH